MCPQTVLKENERTLAGINAGPHIIQQRLSRRLMLEVTWPPIPEPLDPLLETRRLAWRWWCNRVGSTTWNGSLEPIGEVASPTHSACQFGFADRERPHLEKRASPSRRQPQTKSLL